jgi:hypothetical protein
MKINLPDDVVKHELNNTVLYTVPADGFAKLIGYESQKGSWIHRDYRVENLKKKDKKAKKNKHKT